MGTLADIHSIDAVGHCSNKNSLLSLMEVLCGCPVAGDLDENPFLKRPEDLTENVWHLVRSDRTGNSESTLWKPKGEARQIILNVPIICWEITREFQETNHHRTDWMMLEYKIMTVANESFSICRIWQDQTSHVQVGSSMPFDNNQKRQSGDDNPVENSPDLDIFPGGDYLELLDLEVPLHPEKPS